MFGLSTQEVELKNVYNSYLYNINIYYELMKNGLENIDLDSEVEIKHLFDNSTKIYFDKSKDDLFVFLRTQYKDFDLKFNRTLNNDRNINKDRENLGDVGFQAGTLFHFVYLSISGKEPKSSNCIGLNQSIRKLMDDVLVKIQSELNI